MRAFPHGLGKFSQRGFALFIASRIARHIGCATKPPRFRSRNVNEKRENIQILNSEMIYKSLVGQNPPMTSNEETRTESVNGDLCSLDSPHRAGDVVLRDGSTVHVRKMQPGDDQALFALFQSLSEESRWLRFFSLGNGSALAAEARRETNLDHTFGLIALSGPDERVVGHAFYAGIDQNRAEVAFTIADDFQRRGLGTLLLGQLAEVATVNGVQTFEAEVVAANHAMLHVFRESGFPIEVRASAGQLHLTLPTSFTSDAVEKFERRESRRNMAEMGS
jgi:RimJ/RimL family protein N-acetyltransferase